MKPYLLNTYIYFGILFVVDTNQKGCQYFQHVDTEVNKETAFGRWRMEDVKKFHAVFYAVKDQNMFLLKYCSSDNPGRH